MAENLWKVLEKLMPLYCFYVLYGNLQGFLSTLRVPSYLTEIFTGFKLSLGEGFKWEKII